MSDDATPRTCRVCGRPLPQHAAAEAAACLRVYVESRWQDDAVPAATSWRLRGLLLAALLCVALLAAWWMAWATGFPFAFVWTLTAFTPAVWIILGATKP